MPSKNAVGVAPLVCGTVLVGQSLASLSGALPTGVPLYALVAQLLGGGAAVVVGVGILRQWAAFGGEETDTEFPSAGVALVAVALFAFAVGAFVVVLG
jgi:hypothetical protein